MGPAVVSYRFRRMPSTFRYFPRAVFGRRSALVPEGQSVPRLEGSVESVSAMRGTWRATARSAVLRTTATCP